MIKKDQDTGCDPDRVCYLQYRESACILAGDKLVHLPEKLRHIYIIIECHD